MMAVLHICRGPRDELARKSAGVKFCFKCRKHLVHDLVVMGDEEPSYYEPVASCRCSRCGEDHTRFPGTVF